MKKILFLILTILLFNGCSNDIEESKPTDKKVTDDLEKYNRDYKMQEISVACVEGCMYNYNLYTTANSLITKAVSLNSAQLTGIQVACSKFCNAKVLEKLDVLYQYEKSKNATKQAVKESKPDDKSDSEIDNDIKKEVAKKKVEPVKDQKQEDKAFEDL